MAKSPDAFRTISEVADWLGVQAHVLRFWESKFAQVKPIKRAGGRRYYRPADMLLLGGLKKVLHEDGLTIKGAQKLLREKGVSHVADMSQPLDDLTMAVIEGSSTPVESEPELEAQEPASIPDAVEVVAEEPAHSLSSDDSAPIENAEPDPDAGDVVDTGSEPVDADTPEAATAEMASAEEAADPDADKDDRPDLPLTPVDDGAAEPAPMITFRARHRDTPPAAAEEPQVDDSASVETATGSPEPPAEPAQATEVAEAVETDAPATAQIADTAAAPKPQRIEVTLVHDHTEIEVTPSALSAISAIPQLTPEQAQEIRPLLARLTRLRASMANPRNDLGKD